MHIHLDLLGGLAGDMFIAAMLDLRPDLTERALSVVEELGLSDRVRVACIPHKASGFTGRQVSVTFCGSNGAEHHHRNFRDIRTMIEASRLATNEKTRSLDIFGHLARAEARVHGVPPDAVHFHEVGALDSIIDIVTAARILEQIGPCRWSASPIPTGSGRVRCQHGIIPVPAPATILLLEGMQLVDDGIPGERVTPTGAALLKHLQPGVTGPSQPMKLQGSGTGFGHATLPGIPNMVRAIQYTDTHGARADRVATIAFEVDDQTPEDLATGLEILRDRADVLDVFVAPVLGKKNRQAQHVTILARSDAEDAVIEAAFEQTTTLGLRVHHTLRRTLERRMHQVGETRVKVADRPGGATAKAEADDLADVTSTALSRVRRAHAATDAALRLDGGTQ